MIAAPEIARFIEVPIIPLMQCDPERTIDELHLP
jgi:hypothetical protein